MTLPEAFIEDIRPYLSAEELDAFCGSLTDNEQTTCIRINRNKMQGEAFEDCKTIGWNVEDGRYLNVRPNFTLDPRMHAGCYYVQEASSQFITEVVRQLVPDPITALDLCAAPGGKSTALLSVMPEGSILLSNEIDRRRARILAENVTKWGNPNVCVTCNTPSDLSGLKQMFDLVATDVPCSGEGMFRKDEGSIADWSPQKVSGCVSLQREILRDIWPTLKDGGLLIYSTCTFNVHEDEEMLTYICEELGAEAIEISTEKTWNIHRPLIGDRPCYRFMPHYTQGEGLFMAVVRKLPSGADIAQQTSFNKVRKPKKGINNNNPKAAIDIKRITPLLQSSLRITAQFDITGDGSIRAIPEILQPLYNAVVNQGLYVLQCGVEMGTIKGKDIIPAHALALSIAFKEDSYPTADISLEVALNYLRHEAIILPPDIPKGYVLLKYEGHPLGFVKNLGNRCNSLYPQEWRIRFL